MRRFVNLNKKEPEIGRGRTRDKYLICKLSHPSPESSHNILQSTLYHLRTGHNIQGWTQNATAVFRSGSLPTLAFIIQELNPPYPLPKKMINYFNVYKLINIF